ncbi:hypothetical protein P8452_08567 [Trifolium repens]|nr:hypothetical protein P8452_08567 [Trifolium repens]
MCHNRKKSPYLSKLETYALEKLRFEKWLAQKSAYCPISVERWDEMSVDSSRAQWTCIEDHFEFDYAAGVKWEEILANCPSNVSPAEWASFVHHYTKNQMKKLSQQNTKNRKMLKVSHAGGSKSNARRGRQMELQLDRPVCRGEVILSTLLKKNGNYVNDEGKAMADKILENLSQDQERVATLGVPSKINAYPDDAVGKAYGAEHSGR